MKPLTALDSPPDRSRPSARRWIYAPRRRARPDRGAAPGMGAVVAVDRARGSAPGQARRSPAVQVETSAWTPRAPAGVSHEVAKGTSESRRASGTEFGRGSSSRGRHRRDRLGRGPTPPGVECQLAWAAATLSCHCSPLVSSAGDAPASSECIGPSRASRRAGHKDLPRSTADQGAIPPNPARTIRDDFRRSGGHLLLHLWWFAPLDRFEAVRSPPPVEIGR